MLRILYAYSDGFVYNFFRQEGCGFALLYLLADLTRTVVDFYASASLDWPEA